MSAPPAGIRFRPMEAGDLHAGHRLSASFAWPHRLEDWALMLQLGEGLVAEQGGAVVGTAMAWRYGADAATVGMIMVSPELHGRGTGRRLLEMLLDRLDGRTVRLNATPEGLKLYRSLGFVAGGTVTQMQCGSLPACPVPSGAVRPIGVDDLGWVAALDRRACGMDRTDLLRGLIEHGEGVALDRAGFALCRWFGRGALVGPAVAPDEAAAELLIGHLLAGLEGQFVRIDIPEREALAGWLAGHGLAPVDTVVSMRRGVGLAMEEPPIRFALASQAYG